MLLRNNYPWADNPLKLERALKATAGPGQNQETIKNHYIRLGGKVLNVINKELENTIEESSESSDEVAETPRKPRGRPKRESTDTELVA